METGDSLIFKYLSHHAGGGGCEFSHNSFKRLVYAEMNST